MNRLVMLASLALMTVICAPASAAGSESPAFSCSRAHRADGVAVCQSPALRRLDRRMDGMYHDILGCSPMGAAGVYREEQRAWLQRRRACLGDQACIARLYDRWIARHRARAALSRRAMPMGDCPL